MGSNDQPDQEIDLRIGIDLIISLIQSLIRSQANHPITQWTESGIAPIDQQDWRSGNCAVDEWPLSSTDLGNAIDI